MRKLLTLLAVLLYAGTDDAGTAEAGVLSGSYFTHYTVDLSVDSDSVNGIVKFESAANSGQTSWPDFLQGGAGTQKIDQVFPSFEPLLEGLLLGMSYEGTPDIVYEPQSSQSHLVMFMSNEAAALADGQSFESLFAGYMESDIIHALEVVGLIGSAVVGEDEFNIQYDMLAGFANSVRTIFSTNGSINGWFSIPGTQAVDPGQFKVVMFSDGQGIGSGTVTQDNRGPAAVPEPSTFALFGLGGVGLAFSAYRRRAAAAV